MRKLIIFRGPPGAGKSHAISELGLHNHQLSMDTIRRIIGGVDMQPDGGWSITQAHNKRVYDMFLQLSAERMERGETLALESVFADHYGVRQFVDMARKNRYQVALMDFSNIPEARVREQNAGRDDIARLDDKAMTRWISALRNQGPVPRDLVDRVVHWQEDGSHLDDMRNFLSHPTLDVSHYDRLMFIGDLQGCTTPLIGPGGLLEKGFDDNTMYVFVGDFLDRGPQNGELMRWLMEQAVPRHGQVRWLWGNHEDHLHRWSRGLPPVSLEFAERTLPQLLASGLTPKDAEILCRGADEVLLLNWRGQKIVATHAGLPTLPPRIELVSTYQLTHGTGSWSDPVDHQFSRLGPHGWTQVHGHRNHGRQDVIATPQSINLEDSVERGGMLRAAVLDANGWTPIEVPNEDFLSLRQRLSKRKPDWAPAWMSDPRNTRMDDELMKAMREHEGVNQSTSRSMPDIASLNFTRDVFFKKSWDDVSVKARGLFFHIPTGEIVARGYDKFFNINERPETTMEGLARTLTFPVVAYVKENGYLGNLGLNPANNQLVYASKSTPDSDFAAWFKEIMESITTPNQREQIRRFLRDYECSMVFEVIDPVRDPHMVEYDKPQLVLLDAFHRSTSGKKLSHDELRKVGESLGLVVKQRAMVFRSMEQMKGFLDSKEGDLEWRFENRDIEGFVFEDAAGFQTKDKAAHYSFWKEMRGQKDRMLKLRQQKEEIQARPGQQRYTQALAEIDRKLENLPARKPHPLAKDFIEWMANEPTQRLSLDILSLRKAYMEERKPDPALWKTRWLPYGEQPKPSRGPSP